MTLTLSPEEQYVADLGERREQAFQRWRDLTARRTAYFATTPAMTRDGAAALEAVDEAERTYRDLHRQWLEAQRRLWDSRRR